MTEPTPEPEQHEWLSSADVFAWLKLDPETSDKAAQIELCRLGAADWVEDQRRDLFDDDGIFVATPRIVSGALLSVARIVARIDSPNGVVSFDELGAGSILTRDPDVRRLLGLRRIPLVG